VPGTRYVLLLPPSSLSPTYPSLLSGGVPGSLDVSYFVPKKNRRANMCLFFSFQQSIPQTRAHFQNIVLGIAEWDRDVVWREEWEVEESAGVGSPRSAKGKEKDRGKRRVSSGVGG
jgi:hypothetical protein